MVGCCKDCGLLIMEIAEREDPFKSGSAPWGHSQTALSYAILEPSNVHVAHRSATPSPSPENLFPLGTPELSTKILLLHAFSVLVGLFSRAWLPVLQHRLRHSLFRGP